MSSTQGKQGESDENSSSSCEPTSSSSSLESDARHQRAIRERRRRETTRGLVTKLKNLVPNGQLGGADINSVLGSVLEFLTEETDSGASKKNSQDLSVSRIGARAGRERRIFDPYDDTFGRLAPIISWLVSRLILTLVSPGRRYLFAYDHSPLGIVFFNLQGKVLHANETFLCCFNLHTAIKTSTIVSLTNSEFLPMTMRVSANTRSCTAPYCSLTRCT